MKQITLADIERMDGLVTIEDLKTVVETSKSIIEDLTKDGFDKGEVATYLWFCIDQQRMPLGSDRHIEQNRNFGTVYGSDDQGLTEAECHNKRERSR